MMAERSLTSGEIVLATTVFKKEISYEKVKIFNSKWTLFQSTNRAMAPNGNIYYPEGNSDYSVDFSKSSNIHSKATFIHELAHVWQHQKGVNVILKGAFQRDYDYLPLTIKTKFDDLGIEQQAQLIRDYYYLLNNFHGKGWPVLSIYIHVIPFLP